MIATAPRNRMETNQDVGTDPALFAVLNQEFRFVLDLAATAENKLCPNYLGKGDGWLGKNLSPEEPAPPDGDESKGGSLDVPWHHWTGWLWLNPPFRNIMPWARKCKEEAELGARIVMLVPAAVDSDWFEKHVYEKAEVRWLKSRPVFKYRYTKDGPKDPKTGKPRYLSGEWNKDGYPKPCQVCVFEKGRPPRLFPWDWRGNLKRPEVV
jgi:phage N-6-adenine-methyltransferase